jgi:hypothetical protein
MVLLALALLLMLNCAANSTAAAAAPETEEASALEELDAMIDTESREFLVTELQRLEPPRRIRRLSRYQAFQVWLGAGFRGELPNQLVDPRAIPIPTGEGGVLETARFLARQRWANQHALAELLAHRRPAAAGSWRDSGTVAPPGLDVEIEWGVIEAFLRAMEDGEVSLDEAREIARLPANREMILASNRGCSSDEPRLSEESLAVLIAGAGSRDPLDRLWCWLNPANQFGYADLVINEDRYRQMVANLESRENELVGEVKDRVSLVAPFGIRANVRLSLTVSGLMGFWETDQLVGASVLPLKDEWDLLVATIAEDVFRHLLPRFCLTTTGGLPDGCEDLVRSHLDDQRYGPLFELIAVTVFEGAAHFVACPTCRPNEGPRAALGVQYIESFIHEVVRDGHLLPAHEYLCDGMCEDGPLYHLGRYLASTIVDHDGPGAIGDLLREGPIEVVNRAWEIQSESGSGVLTEEMMSVLDALSLRLERDLIDALRIEGTGSRAG